MATKQLLLDILFDNYDVQICSQYGEQGYQSDKPILLGNWNKFNKHPNIMEYLEENFELEWNDEWIIDYDYDKCYRTTPDCYSWEQQFRITDTGELITPDNDIEDWIDYCKIEANYYNSTPHCLPSFIDENELLNHGYKLINDDLENGWYNRNDDPTTIAEDLLINQDYQEVIFVLDNISQFSINFKVYAKKITPCKQQSSNTKSELITFQS